MYKSVIKPKNIVKIVLALVVLLSFSMLISTTFSSYVHGSQDETWAESTWPEQNWADEQAWPEQNWSDEQAWPEQNWADEQVWSEQNWADEQAWPEQNWADEQTWEELPHPEELWDNEVEDVELINPIPIQMGVEGNDYPIILVNAFLFSWGRGELGGLHPWGGFSSIPDFLNEQGFTTLETVIGPFSSNRHRAIELYYYIKGGTVDYGAYSAARDNHERFGRTFPGVYPEWDGTTRVHLVGFSMGGLTARELANLIAQGCQDEIAFHQQNPHLEISPLLAGETTGGIHSITTIATPNNGMSFVENRNVLLPFARTALTAVAALSGVVPERTFFDFRLDQFGLSRNHGETFAAYADRVFSSSIWTTDNISITDLRVNGVTANAVNLQTRPDIYYFSHTGQTTRARGRLGEVPLLTTDPILIPSTLFTIAHRDMRTNPVIDRNWAASDGMVSTVSSLHPFGHPARPYDGNPVRGEWNVHPVMHGWDHSNLHGFGLFNGHDVNQFYIDIATSLRSLPR